MTLDEALARLRDAEATLLLARLRDAEAALARMGEGCDYCDNDCDLVSECLEQYRQKWPEPLPPVADKENR